MERDLPLGDSSSKMELLTARLQVTRPASVAHVRAMAQVKGTRVTRAARALPLRLEHKTGQRGFDARDDDVADVAIISPSTNRTSLLDI